MCTLQLLSTELKNISHPCVFKVFFFFSFILADFFLSLRFIFLLYFAQNPFPQNHATRLKIWLWVCDCCGGGGWVCLRDFFFLSGVLDLLAVGLLTDLSLGVVVCADLGVVVESWVWLWGCWSWGVCGVGDLSVAVWGCGLPILRCFWRGWLTGGSLGWWFALISVDWGGRQEMRREKKKKLK